MFSSLVVLDSDGSQMDKCRSSCVVVFECSCRSCWDLRLSSRSNLVLAWPSTLTPTQQSQIQSTSVGLVSVPAGMRPNDTSARLRRTIGMMRRKRRETRRRTAEGCVTLPTTAQTWQHVHLFFFFFVSFCCCCRRCRCCRCC